MAYVQQSVQVWESLTPVVAGVSIASLVLILIVLQQRKPSSSPGAATPSRGESHSGSSTTGDNSPAPLSGGQSTPASRADSSDAVDTHAQLPSHPHLQATLTPSTGLLNGMADKAYAFENDNCRGEFLPIHRPTMSPELDKSGEWAHGDHFRGRKRLWELRVHFVFKEQLSGSLLVGIELEAYVPLNAGSRRLMGLTVSALRQVAGQDLYHSVGDDPSCGCGPHEKPVFMMPLWACDQMVVTPEGEMPPDLSDPNFCEYGIRRTDDRRAFVEELSKLQPRPGDTYTFAFWGISQFLDCIKWELPKILPFKSIDFNLFCGAPPVQLVFYTLRQAEGAETRHLQSRKNYYFRVALWSSERKPSASKLRELFPQRAAVHRPAKLAEQHSQGGLLNRLLNCCSGTRALAADEALMPWEDDKKDDHDLRHRVGVHPRDSES